jgi:hypothetical protein
LFFVLGLFLVLAGWAGCTLADGCWPAGPGWALADGAGWRWSATGS